MKTLLVTGGAGFIGGNFVLDTLAAGGWRIVNLDALTYAGNLDTLAAIEGRPDYAFEHGDIGDAAFVRRVLAGHRPDAVVNFAAESHVDRSIDGPAAFVQTNVVGTNATGPSIRAVDVRFPPRSSPPHPDDGRPARGTKVADVAVLERVVGRLIAFALSDCRRWVGASG